MWFYKERVYVSLAILAEALNVAVLFLSSRKIRSTLFDCVFIAEKEKMKKEMEAEIRAQLALNQEAMQSWDEKVSLCLQIHKRKLSSLNTKPSCFGGGFFCAYRWGSLFSPMCSHVAASLLQAWYCKLSTGLMQVDCQEQVHEISFIRRSFQNERCTCLVGEISK